MYSIAPVDKAEKEIGGVIEAARKSENMVRMSTFLFCLASPMELGY